MRDDERIKIKLRLIEIEDLLVKILTEISEIRRVVG